MLHKLYAITRIDSRKIELATFSDVEFLKQLTNYFNESDTLLKFIITQLNDETEIIIFEKELPLKHGKVRVR